MSKQRGQQWKQPDKRTHRLMLRTADSAQAAHETLERHQHETLEQMAMALRALEDSSDEYRRAVNVLRTVVDAHTIAQAKRAARIYLESIR